MERYFYIKNNKRLGPFSIAQLNNENIKKNTLVWKEGLEDWVKASELIELKEVIIPEPPPIPKPPPIPNKPLLSKVVKKDIYDPDYKKEYWLINMTIFLIIIYMFSFITINPYQNYVDSIFLGIGKIFLGPDILPPLFGIKYGNELVITSRVPMFFDLIIMRPIFAYIIINSVLI